MISNCQENAWQTMILCTYYLSIIISQDIPRYLCILIDTWSGAGLCASHRAHSPWSLWSRACLEHPAVRQQMVVIGGVITKYSGLKLFNQQMWTMYN